MSQYILGLSYNKLIFFIMFFDALSLSLRVMLTTFCIIELHFTTYYNRSLIKMCIFHAKFQSLYFIPPVFNENGNFKFSGVLITQPFLRT